MDSAAGAVRTTRSGIRSDYLHEVEHANDRVGRLEEAIREAVKLAPRPMREVMQALQGLRGIAQISAVTIVSELGQISRFGRARQRQLSGTAGPYSLSGLV